MIKGLLKDADGRTLVLLGLSRANTEMLLEGQPIYIRGLPPGADILIMGGETEEDMVTEVKDTLGDLLDGDHSIYSSVYGNRMNH